MSNISLVPTISLLFTIWNPWLDFSLSFKNCWNWRITFNLLWSLALHKFILSAYTYNTFIFIHFHILYLLLFLFIVTSYVDMPGLYRLTRLNSLPRSRIVSPCYGETVHSGLEPNGHVIEPFVLTTIPRDRFYNIPTWSFKPVSW